MTPAAETASAEAVLAQAEAHLAQRDLPSALRDFHHAETLGASPDSCSAGRWMVFMLLGDFGAAWRESDAIRRRGRPDPHRFWNGEDIAGKRIIVRCLHGFGDAVQLLRYAPLLRATAAEVIWEVPPRLLELAPFFAGVDHAVTWGEAAPPHPPAWDVQLEVMELPYFFRTELNQLPLAEKYLRLPAPLCRSIRKTLSPSSKPRIGLVWESGEWNPARSIPISLLTGLLQMRESEWWNLQGGPAHADSARFPPGSLQSFPGCSDRILTLAGLISQLDLVITVDTLAAHLAGALGVPAWVLLQHEADWRWMVDRPNSPWYPSLRLFRQPTPGDWPAAIHDLNEALRSWTPQHHSNY